ncbi:hypothetical protein ACIP1G_03560 [Pseudomonas sp. NPDC089392]
MQRKIGLLLAPHPLNEGIEDETLVTWHVVDDVGRGVAAGRFYLDEMAR